MVDTERNVVYVLKVDPSQVSASDFAPLTKQIDAVEKRMGGLNKAAAGGASAAADKSAKAHENGAARRERAEAGAQARIEKEREKAAKAEEKRQGKVFRNRAKLLDRIRREEEKAAKARDRELATLMRREEAAGAAQQAAGDKAVSAARKGLDGVTSLGRASVLVLAANDESAAKMLKTFAKFEGVAQLAKGVFDLFEAGRDSMRAYTASVEAAAIAHKSLAAAEALSAAGAGVGIRGAKGGVAKAAGGIVGKVAVAGAGGVGIGVGGTLLAKAVGGVTSAAGGLTSTLTTAASAIASVPAILAVGLAAWVSVIDRFTGRHIGAANVADKIGGPIGRKAESAGNFVGKLFGFDPRGDLAQERLAASGREVVDRQAREQAEADRAAGIATARAGERNALATRGRASQDTLNARLRSQGSLADREQEISRQRVRATREFENAEAAAPGGGQAGVDRLRESQQRLLRLQQSGIALEEEKHRKSIEASQTELKLREDELNVAQETANVAKSQLGSQVGQLARMNPIQARRTIEALNAARSGESIDRNQARLLRGFNAPGSSEAVQEFDIDRLRGQGSTISDFVQNLQDRSTETEKRKLKLDVEVKDIRHELTLKLDADGGEIVEQMNVALTRMMEKFVNQIRNLEEGNLRAREVAVNEVG